MAKRIAIIGAGMGGLCAAIKAKEAGHDVTIFEAMPEMGGMLRYGIPEYRLPQAVLAKEMWQAEPVRSPYHSRRAQQQAARMGERAG